MAVDESGMGSREPTRRAKVLGILRDALRQKSMGIIEAAYDEILSHNCIPLTMGGDHTIALPILRAMKKKYGPIGMVRLTFLGEYTRFENFANPGAY